MPCLYVLIVCPRTSRFSSFSLGLRKIVVVIFFSSFKTICLIWNYCWRMMLWMTIISIGFVKFHNLFVAVLLLCTSFTLHLVRSFSFLWYEIDRASVRWTYVSFYYFLIYCFVFVSFGIHRWSTQKKLHFIGTIKWYIIDLYKSDMCIVFTHLFRCIHMMAAFIFVLWVPIDTYWNEIFKLCFHVKSHGSSCYVNNKSIFVWMDHTLFSWRVSFSTVIKYAIIWLFKILHTNQ